MSWLLPIETTYFSLLPKELLSLLEDYVSSDIQIESSRRVIELPDDGADDEDAMMHADEFIAQISIPILRRAFSFELRGLDGNWHAFFENPNDTFESFWSNDFSMVRTSNHELEFYLDRSSIRLTLDSWDTQRFIRKLEREIKGAERKAPLPEDE